MAPPPRTLAGPPAQEPKHPKGLDLVTALYWLTGLGLTAFLGLLLQTSLSERRRRPAGLAAVALTLLMSLWVTAGTVSAGGQGVQLLLMALIWIGVLAFILPTGRPRPLRVTKGDECLDEQVDERDVIFAREEYRAGSDRYARYYATHPDLKASDDKLRRLPELLGPGGRYHEAGEAGRIDEIFAEIVRLGQDVDGPVAPVASHDDAAEMTAFIKEL